jgi:hypothetical protein
MNALPVFRKEVNKLLEHVLEVAGLEANWTNKGLHIVDPLNLKHELVLVFEEVEWKKDKGATSQYPVTRGMSVGSTTLYEMHKDTIDTILNEFQCDSELAADVLMLTPIERLLEVMKTERKEEKEEEEEEKKD